MAEGVRLVPPPAHLLPDLQYSINHALMALHGDQRGALVLVGTRHGDQTRFNAAIVAKIGTGWAVEGWIAKSWGETVDGGSSVQWTW